MPNSKSGLDMLIEALTQSGVNMGDGFGKRCDSSQSSSEEGESSSSGGSGSRGSHFGGGNGFHPVENLNVSFKGPETNKGKIGLIVALVLVLGAAYWWFHPAISINSVDVWMFLIVFVALPLWFFFTHKSKVYATGHGNIEKSPSKEKHFKKLRFIPIAIVVVYLLGQLLSLSVFPGNAEKYSSILQTDTLEFKEDIKEVNYSEIPVIDRDSAVLLGNREMGTISEYVSQFEISDLYSQINYQGKPVRVSPLNYADLFKWFTNKDAGIPAYALVDMTTQEAQIVRLGDSPIYYSKSEPLERNIDRYVQLKYPFYIFDEKSFEIDESGHPYWICPVRSYTIGLFGGYTIDRVVVVDATTGDTQDMSINDVPEWIDRAYPSELLITQYNWYGRYHNGWLNSFLGQEGVVKTTPGSNSTLGYNYIAKDDDVWVYTGVTSATSDDSIIGFVLMNQRTHESHFYSVSGATEESAMGSAEGQVQNLRYSATFPLLINVSNQPTYFMALKDSAGLVKKFAMVDIQRYQNVAVGDTVAQTQQAYEALLATNGIVSDDSVNSVTSEASGKISLMAQAVIDNNTHFYVMLEGDDKLYDFKLPSMLDIVRFKEGDTISFEYVTTSGGSNEAYSIKGYSTTTDASSSSASDSSSSSSASTSSSGGTTA